MLKIIDVLIGSLIAAAVGLAVNIIFANPTFAAPPDRFNSMGSMEEYCVYKTKLSVAASYFFIKDGVDHEVKIIHEGYMSDNERTIIAGIIEEARDYFKQRLAKEPTRYIDPVTFGDEIYRTCMGTRL